MGRRRAVQGHRIWEEPTVLRALVTLMTQRLANDRKRGRGGGPIRLHRSPEGDQWDVGRFGLSQGGRSTASPPSRLMGRCWVVAFPGRGANQGRGRGPGVRYRGHCRGGRQWQRRTGRGVQNTRVRGGDRVRVGVRARARARVRVWVRCLVFPNMTSGRGSAVSRGVLSEPNPGAAFPSRRPRLGTGGTAWAGAMRPRETRGA